MIRDFNNLELLHRPRWLLALGLLGLPAACGEESADKPGSASAGSNTGGEADARVEPEASTGAGGEDPATASEFFALGSVVIGDLDMRTTYLQTLSSLDGGFIDNKKAIEIPGNGVLLASGASVFAGLAEAPTWVRYTADASGKLEETGRLSLLSYGVKGIDYGNAIVREDLAVSVLSGPAVAVVWNPLTMEVLREVDLKHLVVDGYGLEVWTTIAHDGLVYIPGRWADWEAGKIRPGVSTTIIDPEKGEVVGVAEDDRCTSGGRVVFDQRGYAYVMGDGRTYMAQAYAKVAGAQAPMNCLLRIAPGKTDFDEDFFYSIPELSGGLDSITELDTGAQGSGFGFTKMFYANQLPDDVSLVDFTFWDHPVHKMWRIQLADPPVAHEVDGLPFSAVGFDGSASHGKLYTGESLDKGSTSDVYEIDPTSNHGERRFTMTGYFYGLYPLSVK